MMYPRILNNLMNCTACGACVNVCGVNCIELCTDKEGFLMPVIDMSLCVNCGLCDKVCHALVEKSKVDLNLFEGYAGWSRDPDLVYNSSSGGFCSIISRQILNDSGVVFGAKYNYDKKRLEHSNTEECDFSALRKSKYIESNTLASFYDVKSYLKLNRSVLFCGTPCQILGLKRYLEVLKVNTDKLVLVDFICHGVPSNEHFTQYISKIEKQLKSKLTKIDFRSKIVGWSGESIVSEYVAANGKYKRMRAYLEDPFYLAFYENILLRKSCYSCEAIHYHSSDFTLGDFWGRQGVIEDKKKGISLMIVNTEKGKEWLKSFVDSSGIEIKKLETNQFTYAYDRVGGAYSLGLRDKMIKEVQDKGFVRTVNSRYWYRINVYKSKELVKKLIMYKQ